MKLSAPQLVGVPYDASSSFLRGAAGAPPLIRAAMASPAGNSFTESGADLTGLADAGDLALGEDAATARAVIQSGISARGALDKVLLHQELVSRHQTLIARVNQMIEHLSFRAFRNAHELRELFVLESREAFGDIARARPGSVVQLFAVLEAALEVRLRKVSIDLHLELMRQLPGRNLSEIFESCLYVALITNSFRSFFMLQL